MTRKKVRLKRWKRTERESERERDKKKKYRNIIKKWYLKTCCWDELILWIIIINIIIITYINIYINSNKHCLFVRRELRLQIKKEKKKEKNSETLFLRVDASLNIQLVQSVTPKRIAHNSQLCPDCEWCEWKCERRNFEGNVVARNSAKTITFRKNSISDAFLMTVLSNRTGEPSFSFKHENVTNYILANSEHIR